MHRFRLGGFTAAAVAITALASVVTCAGAVKPIPHKAASPAPVFAFHLRDDTGQLRTAKDITGPEVTLFFFCGCDRCHAAAEQWSQAFGSGSATSPGKTVIAFAGSADEAMQFAADSGIDKIGATILVDPTCTLRLPYNVENCPRAFVLDKNRKVTFSTKDIGYDKPFSATEFVARTITAAQTAGGAHA